MSKTEQSEQSVRDSWATIDLYEEMAKQHIKENKELKEEIKILKRIIKGE